MESINRTLLALTKNNVKELVPTDPQFKARTDALIELGLLGQVRLRCREDKIGYRGGSSK